MCGHEEKNSPMYEEIKVRGISKSSIGTIKESNDIVTTISIRKDSLKIWDKYKNDPEETYEDMFKRIFDTIDYFVRTITASDVEFLHKRPLTHNRFTEPQVDLIRRIFDMITDITEPATPEEIVAVREFQIDNGRLYTDNEILTIN